MWSRIKGLYFDFVRWLGYPTSGQLQRMLWEDFERNIKLFTNNNGGMYSMDLSDKLNTGALIADNLEKIILDLEKTIKNEMPEFCKNNIESMGMDYEDGSLIFDCMVKNNLVNDVYECLDKWWPNFWLITDEGDYYSSINAVINLNTIKYFKDCVN